MALLFEVADAVAGAVQFDQVPERAEVAGVSSNRLEHFIADPDADTAVVASLGLVEGVGPYGDVVVADNGIALEVEVLLHPGEDGLLGSGEGRRRQERRRSAIDSRRARRRHRACAA